MPYSITICMSDEDEESVFTVDHRHPRRPDDHLLVLLRDEATRTYEALFEQPPTGVCIECEIVEDEVEDASDPRAEVLA